MVIFCVSFTHTYRLHLPAEIVPATHKKAARPPKRLWPESGPYRYVNQTATRCWCDPSALALRHMTADLEGLVGAS